MNFFLRNSQSFVYEFPAVAHNVEKDPQASVSTGLWPGDLSGEDGRLVESSAKMRTRMAIEDHADVPTGGSIIVPFKALAEDWYSTSSLASLLPLDRPFIFAGERFHIVLYISVHPPQTSDVITPYKVAAAVQDLPHALNDTSNHKQDIVNSFHGSAQQDSVNVKSLKSAKNILRGNGSTPPKQAI